MKNMTNKIRQLTSFIIIGLVAAACGSSMADSYDIAIYCKDTKIKIKVISDEFFITHNDGPYYYENADFLWLYIGDEEFESSIFNTNAMVVYKIENQQIEKLKEYVESKLNNQELLKTIDSLDLALEKEQSNEEMKSYLDGFKMIRNGLYESLKKEGVTEIEALGKISDPHTMEPISVMHVEGKENEEVIAVFQKGYMYKDRVLRAAKVVVNQNEDEPHDDENKE